jgi:dihydroflavonol-4-reductase
MATLVTGATGFVGLHVTRLLVERTKDVRVLVRATSERRFVQSLPVEFFEGDLRDAPSLTKALDGVTNVFHVAADYRLWSRDPRELYASNLHGTMNLINAAQKAGIERFIYTSTVGTIAVPHSGRLPDETTKATLNDMIGHYKKSKLMAEEAVLDAAAKGFPAVIVNPTTPVGPCDWKPTPTGRIILDFLNRRMPAYVDTGMNVVGVEDVAEGHWQALHKGRIGQRYILGGRNMTLKQILDSLAAAIHRPAPRLKMPYTAALAAGYAENIFCFLTGREPRIPLEGVRMSRHKMFVNCSLATQELGFSPGSVDAALERAAQWYMDNGYVNDAQSRGAVKETSPGRKPGGHFCVREEPRSGERITGICRTHGAHVAQNSTPGSRPGLDSAAAPRLETPHL